MQSDDDSLLAEVDLGVYHISALLRVVHRFTDRCYLHLKRRSEQIVENSILAFDMELVDVK